MNTDLELHSQAKRILVVEDVQIIQRMMRIQLGKLGAEVVIAKTGQEALSYSHHHFDLILMDLHLPDMTGYEIIKCMHEDPAHDDSIPIVIATSESAPNANELMQVAELIKGYFRKPLSFAQLTSLVV